MLILGDDSEGFQPSLRDGRVLTDDNPALKRWAIFIHPSGMDGFLRATTERSATRRVAGTKASQSLTLLPRGGGIEMRRGSLSPGSNDVAGSNDCGRCRLCL